MPSLRIGYSLLHPHAGWFCRCRWCIVGLLLVGVLQADDAPGELQITFMRDRPIFVRLEEKFVENDGRKVRQQFFVVVQEGEAELTEPIVARWTSGMANFALLRDEAKSRLKNLLMLLKSATPLTDEQTHKLTVAGMGDVARYADDCEAVFITHRQRKLSWDQLQELSPGCLRLRERFVSGLHGEGSLFRKLLSTMLEASELQRVIAVLEHRPPPAVRPGF
jgi:hypothetical protein